MSEIAVGYPIILRDKALELGTRYQRHIDQSAVKPSALPDFEDETTFWTYRTIGRVSFDMGVLDQICLEFEENSRGLRVSERQEVFASTARKILDSFPYVVTQDLDFWRYLGLIRFKNYVYQINKRMAPGDYGGIDTGIDRWELIEGVRWAHRLAREANDEYLSIIGRRSLEEGYSPNVRDSYVSNIIRPSWAKHGPAARGFLDAALEAPALFDDNSKGASSSDRKMNQFQQKIGALQNNVLYSYLDQADSAKLFRGMK